MNNKLFINDFKKKIRIKVYGRFWRKDENTEELEPSITLVKIFQTDVDLSEYDLYEMLVDVENIER